MNTMPDTTPGQISFEEYERIIEQAHKMRSQALADIGTALWSFVRLGFRCLALNLRAVATGHSTEKCA